MFSDPGQQLLGEELSKLRVTSQLAGTIFPAWIIDQYGHLRLNPLFGNQVVEYHGGGNLRLVGRFIEQKQETVRRAARRIIRRGVNSNVALVVQKQTLVFLFFDFA